jgi:hypothetical protein
MRSSLIVGRRLIGHRLTVACRDDAPASHGGPRSMPNLANQIMGPGLALAAPGQGLAGRLLARRSCPALPLPDLKEAGKLRTAADRLQSAKFGPAVAGPNSLSQRNEDEAALCSIRAEASTVRSAELHFPNQRGAVFYRRACVGLSCSSTASEVPSRICSYGARQATASLS